jgi:hypothetical protein
MSEKAKPISKKIRAAIDALVDGENITAAARIAGLTREHLSRELGRQHIAALLRQKIERNLAINAAKAGVTKVRLLSSENGMVADRASSYILSLAGISPQTVPPAPSGPKSPGGVIQIITHDPRPPMIDVTPQVITP